MRSRRITLFVSLLLIVAFAGAAGAAPGKGKGNQKLEMYEAEVDAATLSELTTGGYDIASIEPTATGATVRLVLTNQERNGLRGQGIDLQVVRDAQGRTQSERAKKQAEDPKAVFRPFDGAGNLRDEMYRLAAENPQLIKLEVLGETEQGREYIALKLTQGARGIADGTRPAVLYVATHHAREWISTEVARRLLSSYIERWRANDTEIKNLLKDTELWFVLVHNPDGYQYTFDVERLWRKNLRDNDGDGAPSALDGVDPNRNYPEHWNYDEEGSSSQIASQVYRGPSPASEPETQALMGLMARVPFKFAISYHSFGQLLLYPQGWQVQTASADDPIYVALTGIDPNPAVPGFDPDLSSELYTTNGEFTDFAHGSMGALAWTPELSEGCEGCGFVFPADEAAVQAEFLANLDFALRVAKSAVDPDDPVSHAGIDTKDLYLDVSTTDPWKTNNPQSDLTFATSYAGGSSQPVEVLAKRAIGAVTLHYRISGGATQTASTSPSPNGERYGGNNAYNVYYHYLRGTIPGLAMGDSVEYWFTGGGSTSEHATFSVAANDEADVLVVAAEDRTGRSTLPAYASTSTPNYLSYYTDALTANGIAYDVYDVDAMGRTAPDQLGVLSHYRAVVWYTGNDLVTREVPWPGGNSSRLANDMMLEMRQYLNEGGKLLYTGQWAGAVENGVAGGQFYDPINNAQCFVGGQLVVDTCQLIGDKNDFIQYYLGAYIYESDAGTDPGSGEPFPVAGVSNPFAALGWSFNGSDSAQNQVHTAALITTSSILKPADYPQFESSAPAIWDTGFTGAFEPFDGDKYMYSQAGDVSFKRITRTIDLTGVAAADNPTLDFRFSYDTEPAWDFVFVEAHPVGSDAWTTLPDANGHTSSSTGDSCAAGWFELHPWLERYQGTDCSGANSTTGAAWNASSGRSAGWEDWSIALGGYAGSQVEVSISYASDWSIQGLGAFVDDISVSHGGGTTSFEDDADPTDGWAVTGPADGSGANPNNWIRSPSVGLQEGSAVATDDTLYFGFGLEGITDASARADVMARAIGHLLP